MLSKPLLKQSCKANGVMWIIISFAVCFMLSCVMLIAGNGNISKTKVSIKNAIIEGQLESNTQERAINYFELTNNALQYFNKKLIGYQTSDDPNIVPNAYSLALNDLQGFVDNIATEKGYEQESNEYLEIKAVIFYVLNPMTSPTTYSFDDFYISLNETPAHYDLSQITNNEYVENYAFTNSSIFLAGNMIKEENVEAVLNALKDYGITREQYVEFGYTDYNQVKNIARSVLVNYRANIEYKLDSISEELNGLNEQEKQQKIQEVKNEVAKDFAGSFLSTLPQDVMEALEDIGSQDMYGILIGSIFFKIAGLLLPIIYVIMSSNNLIAGQVDTGSMAYVLSTPTKRKSVVFTQALYLVGSLLLMFVLTTITSIICLNIVNVDTMLTVGKLMLINAGAFLVMFAMSGISFLASCWFNRSKYSMAIGGGLNIFFLVATILGLFGSSVLPNIIRMEALNAFNYLTIISLFDVISIIDGTLVFLWKFGILFVIGLICYLIAFNKFKKKDLPL